MGWIPTMGFLQSGCLLPSFSIDIGRASIGCWGQPFGRQGAYAAVVSAADVGQAPCPFIRFPLVLCRPIILDPAPCETVSFSPPALGVAARLRSVPRAGRN